MIGLRRALPLLAFVAACGGSDAAIGNAHPGPGYTPPLGDPLADGGSPPDAMARDGGPDATPPVDAGEDATEPDAALPPPPPDVCATSNGLYNVAASQTQCVIGGVFTSWYAALGTPNPCPGTSKCGVNLGPGQIYTGKLSRKCVADAECADYPLLAGNPACFNFPGGKACNVD